MDNSNPNVAILNEAWGMLWDSSTEYYLPSLLANGGTIGGNTIDSLSTVSVPDMPSMPVYSSSTWGEVDVTVTDISVTGVPNVTNGGFTPSADASTVSGTVTFTQISVSCDYAASATGLVGCAMTNAEANANAGPLPPMGAAAATAGGQSSHMDLAAQYRDQLVQNGGSGPQMVSTYYDHNDTMNTIVTGTNAFTKAWPVAEPAGPGRNTAFFMDQTNTAAQNPKDQTYTVGDDDYNQHAYYMQSILLSTAQYYSSQQEDPDNNPYNDLANAISGFQNVTQPYAVQQTVGNVMSTVQNNQSSTLSATYEETPIARKARELAERDFPKWQALAEQEVAERMVGITTYSSNGTISGTVSDATLSFTGTVQVSGLSPDQTLSITITDLTVAATTYSFTAASDDDSGFAESVQQQLNDATWFQNNIVVQINNQIEASSLETSLSNILNTALNSLA